MPMLLDHHDDDEAVRIRATLRAGYAVEAALIGVRDFPPMRRGTTAIRASANCFGGCLLDGVLAGVIEFAIPALGDVELSSLAVRPDFARRGIGSALVKWALGRAPRRAATVSTAAGNLPAIGLYGSLGFLPAGRFTTPEGIACVALRRAASGKRCITAPGQVRERRG